VKLHIRRSWVAGRKGQAGRAGLAGRAGPAGPAGLACAAGLAGVLLAGCGSAAPPPGAGGGGTGGGGTGGGSAAADPAGPCSGQDVTVSLGLGQVGVAAGSSLYPIDITNRSARDCRLNGYPAAWLARASGTRIGPAAAPDRAVPPQPVRLPPGGSAHAWLQVGTAANYPARTCHPVTSRYLVVRVADGGPARSLQLALPACAGRLPAPGLLLVRPFEPGPGRHGTAG
jgi:hypothetical protein